MKNHILQITTAAAIVGSIVFIGISDTGTDKGSSYPVRSTIHHTPEVADSEPIDRQATEGKATVATAWDAGAAQPAGNGLEAVISPTGAQLIIPETDVAIHVAEPASPFRLTLGGFTLIGGEGSVPEVTELSVNGLQPQELPDIDPWLINVTGPYAGYRLLPQTPEFPKELTLSIPYDPEKIPQGYTASDIRTFYHNSAKGKWIMVPYDSVDVTSGVIVSRTDHFTDFVNAIIQTPEAPQTNAYTPTMMKDIQFANPFDGVNVISPPSANNHGTANLQYQIEIPAGRQGLQPNLAITYNSEGGNGWMGMGWDLKIPSVNVETRWGVPRFDPDYETESYLLAGEQLMPMVHTGILQIRSTDGADTLDPRIEGAFNRIIRHGTSPVNYWWEVTDRNGIVHYYGKYSDTVIQDPHVLCDADDNIASWPLTETRDLHGNFVRYYYRIINHTGLPNGTVPGKQLYPDHITYTGFGSAEGPYKVQFVLDDGDREDIIITGRNGFKEVTAHRLDSIKVFYNSDTVRCYVMLYKMGSFNRSLLCSLLDFSGEGLEDIKKNHEYEITCDSIKVINDDRLKNLPGLRIHRFDYYHEDTPGFKDPVTISSDSGHTSDEMITQIGEMLTNTLSSTINQDYSGTGSIAVGFGGNYIMKNLSVGGDFNYTYSDSKTKVVFMDVNGDGLPDRIYKKPQGYKYRPLRWSGSQLTFDSNEYSISGLSELGREIRNAYGFGIEGVCFAGGSATKNQSTSHIPVYFSDVNGDGLPDLVKEGEVYFNSIDPNGNISFSIPTGDTISQPGNPCNYIIYNGMIDPDIPSLPGNDFPPQEFSSVRLWVAPFTGDISIYAPIQLYEDTSFSRKISNKVNGISYHIQQETIVHIDDTIQADFYSMKNLDAKALHVNKGDHIYFRLNSLGNRSWDHVYWNPEINYQISDYDIIKDADGLKPFHYIADHDFLLYQKQVFQAPDSGDIHVKGKIITDHLSDSVHYLLIHGNTVIKDTIIADSTYNEFTLDIHLTGVDSLDLISLCAQTNTNVNWKKVYCDVEFVYTRSKNLTIDTTSKFNQIRIRPMINRTLFQNTITPTYPNDIQATGNLDIFPKITYSGNVQNSSLVFAVKKKNKIIAEKELSIINNQFVSVDSILEIIMNDPDTLFFEFCSADTGLAGKVSNAEVIINSEIFRAGFSVPYDDSLMKFGNLYRGWGQFSYLNPPDSYINPEHLYIPKPDTNKIKDLIDTSNLNLILDTTNIKQSYEKFKDSLMTGGLYNPISAYFSPMYADVDSSVWRGFGDLTMVGPYRMSNERKKILISQVKYDTPVTKSVNGEKRLAIIKHIDQEGYSFNINGGLGPLSSGASWSSGENQAHADFFDMNGDRFPDILMNGFIQYTLPSGGLDSSSVYHNKITSINNSDYNSKGISAGLGTPEISIANSKSTKSTLHQMKIKATTSLSLGSSGSNSSFTMADVNGDGLQDLISINQVQNSGYIALNIGYGFTDWEPWSFDTISYSRSSNSGISSGSGLSMELDNCYASWTAGVGASKSENHPSIFISDINGDGLADIVQNHQSNGISVAINNGNGFLAFQNWTGINIPDRNESYSFSGNLGGTFGFPIYAGVKLNFSLGGLYSPTFSVDKAQFTDINNDGYPDLVYIDDKELKVRYSTLGRINILKNVVTPTLSSYEIDYELMLCDANMPQRKWVMSEVKLEALGNTAHGADSMITSFEYGNGYYDRYDREFFGYDTVKSTQYQTYNVIEPYAYRSTVETFFNNHCLFKGLKKSETLLDSTGKPVIRTEYTWHRKEIESGKIIPDDSAQCFGPYFPAVSAEDRYYYENQQNYQIHTRKEYEHGGFGNIIKYINKGDTAVPDDSLVAVITYYIDSAKNILGLPDTLVVTHGANVLRKRYATYCQNTGKPLSIRQVNNDDISVIDLTYSIHGNLALIQMPEDYNSFRRELTYGYDGATTTYPVDVTDNLGYSSSAVYDPRFGVPLQTTDVSGNIIDYSYDGFGRLRTVLAPYEADAGTPWTIRFSFWDDTGNDLSDTSFVPWALTEHYDTMNPGNTLKTTTFADGLGRVLQTKKDAFVFENGNAFKTMIVSGQVVYDGLGRVVSSRHPVTDTAAVTLYSTKVDPFDPTMVVYDVLDRQCTIYIPTAQSTYDTNTFVYGFGDDDFYNKCFTTTVTDANNITSVQYTDARGLQTQVYAAQMAKTKFRYNPMGELIESIDPEANSTTYSYDMFGRVVERNHPDAGTTTWRYDAAGNLRSVKSANLDLISDSITYNYTDGRLAQIHYPVNPEMDVYYEYGDNSAGNEAGRITRMQDASGVQQFFYGKMGEIIRNERTFVLPGGNETYTFAMEWEYDSWNRIKQMTYPDGEVVSYDYDTGGQLFAMQGIKGQDHYPIIDSIFYDKFGSRSYIAYGNGTKTQYNYEPYRRRLAGLQTQSGQNMLMDLSYSYDNENNITGISNTAGIVNGLGGGYSYSFYYDDMYRLVSANGSFKNMYDYTLSMSYSPSGNITNKTLEALTLQAGIDVPVDYEATYNYYAGQPHAIESISGLNATHDFQWDANGNMTWHNDQIAGFNRMLCWDEENRLTAVRDENNMSAYIYDAGGERVWKLTGQVQQMYVDGTGWIDIVDLNNKTLYVSPYLVYNETGYSKHYYAGAERVSSRIGGGMQDALVDPLNYTVEILSGQDYTVMAGDLEDMLGRNIECTDIPMQYVSMEQRLGSIEDSRHHNNFEDNRYIYHSDHLGSSAFLTDASGTPTQHLQYLPFGEPFIEQRSVTDYYTPYTFSAKERDTETGYSYFGARYYNSHISVWLSVDPLSDKYPSMSPYMYCAGNPIILVDPDGRNPSLASDDPEPRSARQLAIDRAYQHFQTKTKYLWGMSGAPGKRADCSGLVSDVLNFAGYTQNRNTKGVPKEGGGYYNNGVAKIVAGSVEIPYQALEAGDLVTFKTSRLDHKGPDGKFDHIGIVVDVIANEQGLVTSFDFIHISLSGVHKMRWNFETGKSSWKTRELNLTGAYQWQPSNVTILPTFTVTASASDRSGVPAQVEIIYNYE